MLPGCITSLYNVTWLCYEFVPCYLVVLRVCIMLLLLRYGRLCYLVMLRVCIMLHGCVTSLYHVTWLFYEFASCYLVMLRVCIMLLGHVTSLYHVTWLSYEFVSCYFICVTDSYVTWSCYEFVSCYLVMLRACIMLLGHVTSLYNVTWLCYEFV